LLVCGYLKYKMAVEIRLTPAHTVSQGTMVINLSPLIDLMAARMTGVMPPMGPTAS